MGSDGVTAPECNGICLYGADIGVPEIGDVVAYAHPGCPAHGEEESPEVEPIMDEVAFFNQTGKLFEPDQTEKPDDFDDALPMFRLSVENCHGDQFVEMQLDAADMEVVERVFTALNNGINTARSQYCQANLRIHTRVKPGDIKDEGNFVIYANIAEGK